jgi:EmrB/QacA subfamily drug resistance transporter
MLLGGPGHGFPIAQRPLPKGECFSVQGRRRGKRGADKMSPVPRVFHPHGMLEETKKHCARARAEPLAEVEDMSAVVQGQTRRSLVVGCIMAALFMSAIEATIVTTAMPQIVGRLGGFALYSWVFSAFLLTQTASTVIFGKLSDIYGRKPVMVGGIIVFLIGSALCGFAWSMPSLIVFRLIQGLGGGSIQPVSMTLAGDLYPARERFKIQAALSSVWALAAVIGPMIGAVIVGLVSWSWVFWINIPIGVLTIFGFLSFLHEDVVKKKHAIDYGGAILFCIAIAALLIALTQHATMTGLQTLVFILVFAVATLAFLVQERRASEPIIALDLWGDRLVASANSALLLATMSLIGVTSYLPVYIQGVMGYPVIYTGFPLTAVLFAWPLASASSGRILRHFSMRATLRFGSFLMPLGAAFLVFLTPRVHPALSAVGPFLMGFGIGLLNFISIVMIQNSVEWSKRGSATASILFSRALGNTLGVAILGAILNYGVVRFAGGAGSDPARVREVLTSIGDVVGGNADPALHMALDSALHLAFWGILLFAGLAAVLSISIPVRELDSLLGAGSSSSHPPRPEEESAKV